MLNVSPLNLLFTVLNLLILLALMKRFLYKPVLNIIAKRQELIDSRFAEADAVKKEAEQLKEQYEACMSGAKEEQERTVKEAKIRARAEYDRIVAEADRQAGQIVEKARKTGAAERTKAVKEAEAEITKLAVEAAAKIAAGSLSGQNDRVSYDEFLKKAGEMSETDSR
ncbi:MAG: F0F1 ATP synthase subunit B [Eubacteriales bacterium]|nr:F0F1 ATP synthase subunit B [Eubacteriales bacterium]